MTFEGIPDEYLESVRQEHEVFLSQLESYAVVGIATGDWNSFFSHVSEFHRHQMMDVTEHWNPDQAGAELKGLFDKADEICSKPIYQEKTDDTPHSASGSGGASSTTAATQTD